MTHSSNKTLFRPDILAPAGSKASFLAAIAAGADAVYCGLKHFSARMKADNFSIEELAVLAQLARKKKVKVNIALNTLIKPSEIPHITYLIDQLKTHVQPNAIIFSDLAIIDIAKKVGFKGGLHLSTLGNLSFQKGLDVARNLGIQRVVVPRELSLDEMRAMSQSTTNPVELEAFIHGALCYGVSGRCYWSSWFGGKSGLRGQCVQPCRRMYIQDGQKDRFFSCQDYSVDELTDQLSQISTIKAWKIEGRKKGPHYVFNTVSAYRLLRDFPNNPEQKAAALTLLEHALGRNTTHYGLLGENTSSPIKTGEDTGSGKVIGAIQLRDNRSWLQSDTPLQPGDLLRIGFEDTPGHFIQKIRKPIDTNDAFSLSNSSKEQPASGTPVFLIDRRQEDIQKMIADLENELKPIEPPRIPPFNQRSNKPRQQRQKPGKANRVQEIVIERKLPKKRHHLKSGSVGLWLSEKSIKSVPPKYWQEYWWWLPPVIWPNDQRRVNDLIRRLLKKQCAKFVLNAPWQLSFFPDKPNFEKLAIWAGPFCNIANIQSIQLLQKLGVTGVFAAPELARQDFKELASQSPLPIGMVLSANWPLCVSRTVSQDLSAESPFASPQGETSWVTKYGQDFWVYPNWKLDIQAKKKELERAGVQLFARINEPLPRGISLRNRPGLWNWDLTLQ